MPKPDVNFIIRATDHTGRAFATARRGLSGVAAAIRPVRAGLALVGGVGGLGLVIRSSLKTGDALAKTSDKLGLTTEALAGMRHAGELTGVSVNTLDMAIQRMTRRIAEAAAGTGEAKGALKELGLDAMDLKRMGPEKAFQEIAGAMGNVTSQGDRVRLSMKLFDSEGVALVNTLALGKDGLKSAADETVKFGTALTRVEAAKIEEANDSMYRAKQAAAGLGNTIALAVSPIITQMATDFADAASSANGFRDTVQSGMHAVASATGSVADAVYLVRYGWISNKFAFDALRVRTLTGMDDINKAVAGFVNGSLQRMGAGFNAVAGFIPGARAAADALKGIRIKSEDLSDPIQEARTGMLAAWKELSALKDAGLPSENIKAYWDEAVAASNAAAEKVAANRASLTAGGDDDAGASTGLDALRKSLRTGTEIINETHRERLAVISAALQQEGANVQELNDLVIRATMDRSEKIAAIAAKDAEKQKGFAVDVSAVWSHTSSSIARGFGESVADALTNAGNLRDGLLNVGRAVVRETISGLVQVGVQHMVIDRIKGFLAKKDAARRTVETGEIVGQQTAIGAAASGPAALVTASTGGLNIPVAIAGLAAVAAAAFAISKREKGGPVTAGVPYLVGERGPEIFAPRQSGQIIPNNMIGRGGGVNNNYTITVNTQATDANRVAERVLNALQMREAHGFG